MDNDVLERLTRIEAKLDRVVAFTNRADGLLASYITGGVKGLMRSLLPGPARSKVGR